MLNENNEKGDKLLDIRNITVSYKEIEALSDVSITVHPREIVAIIGSNGAGKTTIMRSISGVNKISKGEILFKEDVISRMNTDRIVELGIAHVPEGRKLFPQMTVFENLEMGAYAKNAYKNRYENMEKVFSLLPRLKERQNQLAGTLSGGEQQMVAIGRGLMSDPMLLLLDEPSLGLAPKIVTEMFALIKRIRDMGKTILIVEQNLHQTLELADRGYVLENGRIVLEGTGSDLLQDEYTQKAYLGTTEI